MNLQEMKVKELRTLAGEMQIVGRSEMKKEQLISAIEAAQIEEQVQEFMIVDGVSEEVARDMINEQVNQPTGEEFEITPEMIQQVEEENRHFEQTVLGTTQNEGASNNSEEKPVKKPRGEQRKINLLNAENEIVETFECRKEAIRYCMKSGICNEGWASVSLKESRRMYRTKDGRKTSAQRNKGYTGADHILLYAIN
ncbi:Rho termination factor N-terminal domain-containing protein [Lederbergia citri]|uniref:Rho termination factor N-terminal domain-containing protein n=1 Tax=Lederbergia citri TaxID=2833580 RepID=A0A942TDN3_9BACI|nr:Rho termination factor N-terminal domain-containing protein [Lederbergia citri]MBS4194347.1 Rho termination factor N-terminal domain-containing protein [Lederbergia citri]